MKIGVVTGSISRLAGGLFYSVRNLAQEVSRLPDTEVEVHSFADRFSKEDKSVWSPLVPVLHTSLGGSRFGYAPGLEIRLTERSFDLVHSQGIWQAWSGDVVGWTRRNRKPYLISPRGMLDSWALTRGRWKKMLAGVMYERAHLHGASCLHALAEAELGAMRAFGLRGPVCVIPNGVTVPEAPAVGSVGSRSSTGRHLLFLGRLHPKKGMVAALEAWKEARRLEERRRVNEDWTLLVGGWDQGGHEVELQGICTSSGIPWRRCPVGDWLSARSLQAGPGGEVVFVGPAYGQEKDELLRAVHAFLLPSFSEGLPMAVLEAWAYGLPVLKTPQCNLPEGFEAGAAIEVQPEAGSVHQGLRTLFEMSEDDRVTMGAKGRRLVEERFSWPKVAVEMRQVYEWVLGGGPKPGCVVTD